MATVGGDEVSSEASDEEEKADEPIDGKAADDTAANSTDSWPKSRAWHWTTTQQEKPKASFKQSDLVWANKKICGALRCLGCVNMCLCVYVHVAHYM